MRRASALLSVAGAAGALPTLHLDLCADASCSAGCARTSGGDGECVPFPIQGVDFSVLPVLEGSQIRADLFIGLDCGIFSTSIVAAIDTCLPGSDLPLAGLAESFVASVGGKRGALAAPAAPAPRRPAPRFPPPPARRALSLDLCTDAACSVGCQTTTGGEGECVYFPVQGVDFSVIPVLEGSNIRADLYIGADCGIFSTSIVAAVDTCLPGSEPPLAGLAESFVASVGSKGKPVPPPPAARRALSLDLCTDTMCSAGCQTTTGGEGECVYFPVQGVDFSVIPILEGSNIRADLYIGADCGIFSTSIVAAIDTCLPGSELPLAGLAESFVARAGRRAAANATRVAAPPRRVDPERNAAARATRRR